MTAEELRKSILQMAIQGKLVKQDPNDEPASVLLERIREEKTRLIKEGKIKGKMTDSVIYKGSDNSYYEKIGKEVKNIDEEIDFDLPDGWEYIRLATVCWLDDAKKSVGEKLPYLDAKTLRGKSDLTYLSEGKIVDIGTKIILVDGENSGEVFDVPFRGYMGSTFKILGVSSFFDVQYLNTVLAFYKDTFKGSKIGAAIPHLNKNLFRSLLIGLPSIAEQKRIVAEIEKFEHILAEYDKLETQATKLDTEIYDKLKKSILQYAIQGKLVEQDENDEPASVLLERIRAEKKAQLGKKYVESYIYKGDDNCYYEHINGKNVNITEEIPFDLPNGWAWSRLSEAVDVRDGTHDTPQYTFEGFPLITGKDFYNGYFDLSKTQYISKKDYDEIIKRSAVDIGDILFSMIGGNIGSMIKITENNYFPMAIKNVALFKQYLKQATLSNYLFYFLKSQVEKMKQNAKGGAQQFIPLNYLRAYLFPIPPLAEQRRIVDKIDEIFAKL